MNDAAQQMILWLIPGAPLASAIVTALLGPKFLRERSHWPCWMALAISAVCSLVLLVSIVPGTFAGHGEVVVAQGYQWLQIGGVDVRIDLRADAMTAIMLAMVTCVSFLVGLFGAGYMHGDAGVARFFAAISLFVFSMCMLVLAGNFLMMFVFWEAVGLCSYLLIGFWFRRPSAAAAATKAFVVNRIGDFGFIIGVLLIWTTYGSFDFAETLAKPDVLATAGTERATLICLLLFVGAMGKSAQFPLHVWLPDAMEGPTPVSALIHAATMVTAGVYMVARCTPLFALAPTAQMVVSAIGATTALLAALIAITQNDLKRVLAYSTVSQLGYMFMSLGAAAAGGEFAMLAVTSGMFHLFTHAFFKALLFLAAGSVMHAMGDVIDMRRFGGLRKALPITHWTFLCGAAALAGVPLLSGFWSKDDILFALERAAHGESEHAGFFRWILIVGSVTAVITAFYTFRAYFLTFWGEERFPQEAGHHPHESPPVMAWPLRILAICALAIGAAVGPTELFAHYLEHSPSIASLEQSAGPQAGVEGAAESLPEGAHEAHLHVMIFSGLGALVGIGLAWMLYVRNPGVPERLARALDPIYALSLNKFYLDEIYGAILVAPTRGLAWLSALFDLAVIDRIVDGVGKIPRLVSRVLVPIQNGLVSTYALVMLSGAVVCVLVVLKLVF